MPAERTSTAIPMKRTRLAGATYQKGLSGASVRVALSVVSVNVGILSFGSHEIHQRDGVGPGLHGIGGGGLDHEISSDRVARRGQLDESRDHPPPQNVVGEVGPVGFDPDLDPVGGLGQVQQAR